MRTLLFALLFAMSANAQNSLSFFLDNSDGATPYTQLPPLPSSYPFPDTSVGQTASITVRVVNTSSSTVQLNAIYVGATAGSTTANNSFSINGLENAILAPQGWKLFFINFTPAATGATSGYLQVSVAGQSPVAVSTLTGNGLPPAVNLTCADTLASACDGKTPLQPNGAIHFGDPNGIALGSTYSIPFTLTNSSSAPIAKPVLIQSTIYSVADFVSPDLSALPDSVAPGTAVTFTLVFTPVASPGMAPPEGATLTVGNASIALQGNLLTIDGNNPPDITYVYGTGKPCQGCSGNTISMGPAVDTLTVVFTIANTEAYGTPYADITIASPPVVSGTGFTMSTATLARRNSSTAGTPVSAGQMITVSPDYALTFQVTFNGSQAATGTVTIAVGNGITYTLNAQPPPPPGSAGSDLPGLVLMCGSSPCTGQTFTSQEQVQATLQVSAPTTALLSLTLSFAPAVSGITSDPAVGFVSSSNNPNHTGSLSFTTNSNGTASTPQFTFQTGTTAGTITIGGTDPSTQLPFAFSVPILPSKVQITSSTAVRNSPNLTVTVYGYDNTYNVDNTKPLSFTFFDLSGKMIASGIQVDATSAFHQYFFGPGNQNGGAFSLQVIFPVTGDITQVGSVTASVPNSVDTATTTESFQ